MGRAGVEPARLEARLLLAHHLGRTDAALLPHAPIPPGFDRAAFESLLARRLAREPLAFVTGRRGFWTLDLAVSPETLVPRADSETLVEAALAARPGRDRAWTLLDLGTGTGCLLLALLAEYPNARGIGIDLSFEATLLARRNARAHGLDGRAGFLAGRWAEALDARFDLVLSNPPYIPSGEIAGLMPEVARHEPRAALDGGPDGLDAYRAILRALPGLLRPGGLAVLEIGAGQAGPVSALAGAGGFGVEARADLSGTARALVLRPR